MLVTIGIVGAGAYAVYRYTKYQTASIDSEFSGQLAETAAEALSERVPGLNRGLISRAIREWIDGGKPMPALDFILRIDYGITKGVGDKYGVDVSLAFQLDEKIKLLEWTLESTRHTLPSFVRADLTRNANGPLAYIAASRSETP